MSILPALHQVRRNHFLQSILPVVMVLLLIGGPAAFWLGPAVRDMLFELRLQESKNLVRTVCSLVETHWQDAAAGQISHDEAKQRAIRQVSSLRYGDSKKEYFWIHNLEDQIVTHPYSNQIDLSQYRDLTGKLVVPAMNDLVRSQGEGFIEYYWQWNDLSHRQEMKVSYVKLFQPWGWVIGSGCYLHSVEAEFNALSASFLRWVALGVAILFLLILFMLRKNMNYLHQLMIKEEEIKISNQRLKNMADRVHHGIAIFRDHRLVFSNRRLDEILDLQEITDQTERESRIKDVWNRFSDESGLSKNWPESTETRAAWLTTCKGQRKHFLTDLSKHESEPEYYLTIRDNTERQLQEEEVNRLSEIIRLCPVSIVVTDSDGIIKYANPHAEKVSGYKIDEIRGSRPNIFKSDRVPRNVYIDLWSTIKAGQTWKGELLNQRKDGSLLWEYIESVPEAANFSATA